ncbi:hypothetical protein [Paenibacillus piri]|uniref:Flagellar protein FliT n=1 Tax=Paenibacillus piri TaxID=2547395 RepID=A0A4R5KFL5_9BACL|nr:hypothetical protein [Paenibacillus piri]TDF93485.1 hypothetical protein E1757_26490 [Paenibacillus piri]
MDRLITELEELTRQGLEQIEQMTYESVVEFIERRSRIIDDLANLNADKSEKLFFLERVNRVIGYDPVFIQRMNELKEEARIHLAKLETGRVQRNAYDYESVYETESLFFDKKK